MHVISRRKLREFVSDHPDVEKSLYAWYKIATKARWSSPHEIRADYPHADSVGSCVVFNIGGNKYRLITRVFHANEDVGGRVYVLHVLTHDDYSDGKWKADCDSD